MTDPWTHLSDRRMAALVDGALTGEEGRRATEHLARCRTCMAAYSDLVRRVADWRLATAHRPADLSRKARGRKSRWPRYLVAACLPLVMAATAWLILNPSGDAAPSYRNLPPERTGDLVAISHRGMIYPDARQGRWTDQVTFRSGAAEGLDRIDQPGDAILNISLAMAADQLSRARILAGGAADTLAGDPDFLVLQGILTYREDGPRESEPFFRAALDNRPRDPVARFDLGLALKDLGNFEEAAALFEGLASDEDHDLIRHRARRALAEIRAERE